MITSVKIKAVGFLLGFVSSLSMFLIYVFPKLYIFLPVTIFWLLLLFVFSRLYKVPKGSLVLQLSTAFALVTIISLVEQLTWIFIILGGLIFVYLWKWSVVYDYKHIDWQLKSLRRFVTLIWTFNVYTYFSALFAINLFFPSIPFFILSLFGALISAGIAFMVWNLYYPKVKDYKVWTGVMALIILELMWVLKLMPFGYFALALLLTWVWYVAQLFIRFSLSDKGIVWKYQKWFLLANFVLFIIMLCFIRWI